MDRYDVVVVGAGLAGLQCARLLGAAGLRVLLLDRRPSVERPVHTTGIFVRRTLEDYALPDDCLGPVVRDVALYSPAGRALPLSSPHDEFRVGRMGPLYLRFLEEALAAGVAWSPDTRYAGCEPAEGGSTVRYDRGEERRRVHARFVVGADGTGSRVARDLGLDRNTEWIVGVEDVLHGVPAEGPPCFHCFLDPDLAPGYIAWVVHDGEEAHLGTGGYAEGFRPLEALERFRARAARHFDLSRAERVERRGGRIPVGGVLRRIASPRGLLVGDAAGAVSPLTAGGLDPCLRLSDLAAHVAADYLAGEDPAALLPYSGERFRAHFASRLRMRRALAGVRSRALVEAGCALLRFPLLRPLAAKVFFGRGSFPDVGAARAVAGGRPGDRRGGGVATAETPGWRRPAFRHVP